MPPGIAIDIARGFSGGSSLRGAVSDSGHYGFSSRTGNPGTIWKDEADSATNLADLLNRISWKFNKDTSKATLAEPAEGALASAPGEARNRDSNAIKRETPFKIDDVKAAAAIFKRALFDPNIDPFLPGDRGPHYTVPQKVLPSKEELLKDLIAGPRLGDYAANTSARDQSALADDTRNYGDPPFRSIKGIAGDGKKPWDQQHPTSEGAIDSNKDLILKLRKIMGDGEVSNKYQTDSGGPLKVAAPIPNAVPLMDDEYNNPNEETNEESQRPIANLKINKTRVRQTRPGAGIATINKAASFLGYFLRTSYV